MWKTLVRRILREGNMTQQQLARRVHLSQPTISAIVTGGHAPRGDAAIRLVKLNAKIGKRKKQC